MMRKMQPYFKYVIMVIFTQKPDFLNLFFRSL